MGLDMYLERKLYCKNWEHNGPKGQWIVTAKKGGKKFPLGNVVGITEEVCYWRKANHIHKWFVDNVQDGKDDCGTYYVTRKQLKQLLDSCIAVKESSKMVPAAVSHGQTLENGEWKDILKDGETIANPQVAQELLPTASGFFFGGTDYNQWYMMDIEHTIKCLSEELKSEHPGYDYYYSSSW